jgi:hypothetical protein
MSDDADVNKDNVKLIFGSLRGRFYFQCAVIVPDDAQHASEVQEIGTGSEGFPLSRDTKMVTYKRSHGFLQET